MMWARSSSYYLGNSSAYGIYDGQSYTVLSNHIVYYLNGTEAAKLIRVRDPLGADEGYNGTWNDQSPLWKDNVNKFYA